MPRDLSSSMLAAITADVVYPALLVQLSFADSSTIYLWSGVGNLTWNNQTWEGVGALGSVGPMTESVATEANNVTLNLSGIPSDLLTECITEVMAPQSSAQVYLCLFDGPGGNILPDPFLAFSGIMDSPEVTDDGKTSTISISLESLLIEMNRAVFRRYTADDNRLDLAARLTALGLATSTSDLGFSFVSSIQSAQVIWGTGSSNV